MRKRRTLLICVVGVGLALTAYLAYHTSPREPSYNGHPLSYWVAVLGKRTATTPTTEREQATNAVVQIGVAALPFLVKWIPFDPPRWKRTLASGLARTPFTPARKLADRVIDPRLAVGTELSFAILGPRAMPAFDDLCRLMNDTNRPYAAIPAAWDLAGLGTNALPPLLAALTNAHHPAHPVALDAIVRVPDLEQGAQLVVPVVASWLDPTNNISDQLGAISILRHLKAAPETSVPALASALKSTNPVEVRVASANVLGKFGTQAAAAIPALTNAALSDPDTHIRIAASNALNQIDPRSFPFPYGH